MYFLVFDAHVSESGFEYCLELRSIVGQDVKWSPISIHPGLEMMCGGFRSEFFHGKEFDISGEGIDDDM